MCILSYYERFTFASMKEWNLIYVGYVAPMPVGASSALLQCIIAYTCHVIYKYIVNDETK